LVKHRLDRRVGFTTRLSRSYKYIVDSTLGERIDTLMEDVRAELTSDDPNFEAARDAFDKIEEIRFLDVTCGSGSFLIKSVRPLRRRVRGIR